MIHIPFVLVCSLTRLGVNCAKIPEMVHGTWRRVWKISKIIYFFSLFEIQLEIHLLLRQTWKPENTLYNEEIILFMLKVFTSNE